MRPKANQKDLLSLDAWSFCKTGGHFESKDITLEFPRLAGDDHLLRCAVHSWDVRGRVNAKSECVVTLTGSFSGWFSCVVCEQAVEQKLEFERNLILKTSESEADAYDDESLDEITDVVACAGDVNLRDWLEDEILLACPMFSRHASCEGNTSPELSSYKQRASRDDTAVEQERDVQRPFANLGDLLKGRKQ
ncbi:MAG TPA: DUF177 domain-containing protein [Limnobacter sp.]|uniref:YceD family protein n=1 Tax=Limnobacter sp. TaxID=2003368 RepID=UPI002EDAEB61